ncbi:MAG: hypothetical protein ACI4GD_02610 [Lachnospiraceae bacterium]
MSINDELQMLEKRLADVELEVKSLNRQISDIRNHIREEAPAIKTEPVIKAVHEEPVVLAEPVVEKQPERKTETGKKDYEAVFGKTFMGIFASILILVSMVLFANLVLPIIGDVAKQVLFYVISAILIAVGLMKLKGNQKNFFFQGLLGCGLGGMYLSLFLSNLYFKTFNDIVLFIGIFIWIAFICYLSKMQLEILEVIGWIGIFIAMVTGGIQCDDTSDELKLLILVIYYIITSTVFLSVHYKQRFVKNWFAYLTMFLSICALYLSALMFGENVGYIYAVKICLLLYVLVIHVGTWIMAKLSDSRNITFVTVMLCYTFMLSLLVYDICKNDIWGNTIGMMIFIATWIMLETKMKNIKEISLYVFQGITLAFVYYLSLNIPFFNDYCHLALFIPALFGASVLLKKLSYKIYGLIYMMIYLLDYSIDDTVHLVVGVLLLAVLFAIVWLDRKEYKTAVKFTLYIMLQVLLYENLWVVCTVQTTVIVLSIVNVIAMKTMFRLAWDTKNEEKSFNIWLKLSNGINMFSILYNITSSDGLLKWISIIVAILIFVCNINEKELRDKSVWLGIYTGGKLTVLMYVIMSSFDVPDFLASIVCLLFAIVCIAAGFIRSYRSIRIFGLILTMLNVLKLLLVDIYHDNTVSMALAFFAAGILVFGVNLIYHIVDKKIAQNSDN